MLLVTCQCVTAYAARRVYPWVRGYQPTDAIISRIPPPRDFQLEPVARGSFADWLHYLPLKPGRPPVRLYDGRQKGNQEAHFAVIKMDTLVQADLQQCADSVIRVRAEYLYSQNRDADIHFNYTNGQRIDFTKWAQGYRPVVRGNSVSWTKSARSDTSYENFKAYLANVFQYAGTLSLSKELTPVANLHDMQTGDVFIRGGTPGHVVMVMATAVNRRGEKIFLLAQSYMPAQEMHILRNPANDDSNPWYTKPAPRERFLFTPEYTFRVNELMRFPEN